MSASLRSSNREIEWLLGIQPIRQRLTGDDARAGTLSLLTEVLCLSALPVSKRSRFARFFRGKRPSETLAFPVSKPSRFARLFRGKRPSETLALPVSKRSRFARFSEARGQAGRLPYR